MQSDFPKISVYLLLSLALIGGVSAAWSVDALTAPESPLKVSNNTTTVQVVNVTDSNNDPVNLTQLQDSSDTDLNYIYNTTGGSKVEMSWINSGYYYAEFKVNSSKGDNVTYELFDTSSDGGVIDNETQKLNIGNMTVDVLNDFSSPVKFGKTVKIEVNVTDEHNDTHEDEATVNLYFTNGSWMSQVYKIDNHNDAEKYFFNSEVDFPSEPNSTYVMHVNTSRSGAGYNNAHGSESIIVETLPQVQGRIEALNASTGCNNESFFTECQGDTTIDTKYNITESTAENVNVTIQLKNSSSGNWENNSTTKLTKENGLYTAQITLPEFNTSKYDKKVRLRYNATNKERSHIDNYVINYKEFKIVDKSDSVTGKGSYRVKLEIRKYFTPELLETSRIDDSSIKVNEPSGDLLTSFTVDDMDRRPDPGYFYRKIDIPLDAEKGLYEMTAEVTNLYNQTKSETFSFNVTEVQQSFTLNDGDDDFEKEVDKIGNHSFNVSITNDLDSEITVSTEISDIADITTVNDGDNITLSSEEEKNVTIEFDIDSVDEHDGEIKFMDKDANYNSTLDVSLTHGSCDYRNETICVTDGLNASADESGHITKSFIVRNFGEKGESYTVTSELSGNITSYAEINDSSVDFDTENDTRVVEINYSATAPGFYSGTLTVSNNEDSVQIPVSLDSNVESTSTAISVTQEIDLGELNEGSSVSREIEVENTGDVEIDSLSVSSDTYNVEIESASISLGSTETVSLDFSDIESESGTVTVEADAGSGTASGSVTVSASVIPDYEERASQLESRIVNLDSRVDSGSDLQTELNNVQTTIQQVKTAYRQENYDEAERLYRQAASTVDSIESQVASTNNNDNNQNNNQNQSGGLPILPIAAALFVLLVVGFVAYTSIIPEEGDAFYNVLGK